MRKTSGRAILIVFIFILSVYSYRLTIELAFEYKLWMIYAPLILTFSLYLMSKIGTIEKYELVFASWVAWGLVSAPWVYESMALVRFVFASLAVMILYITSKILCYNRTAEYDKAIYKAFALLVTVSAIFGVIGYIKFFGKSIEEHEVSWGVMKERGVPRFVGISEDPNFCSLVLTPCLFYFLFYKRYFFAILSFVLLFLTLSRGGLFGIGVGLALWLAVTPGFFKHLSLTLVSVFLIGGIAGTVISQSELAKTAVERRLSGVGDASGRFELWGKAWSLYEANPLVGIGPFGFQYEYEKQHNAMKFVHNTYLAALVWGGAIGFALYVLFHVGINVCAFWLGEERRWLWLALSSMQVQMAGLSASFNEVFFWICGTAGGYVAVGRVREKYGRRRRARAPRT